VGHVGEHFGVEPLCQHQGPLLVTVLRK
jgi:hypothetical protein